MRAFKVFVFGLLYGWVFKVAFDRIYRQNEMEDIRNENVSLKEYIRSLELQLQTGSMQTKSAQTERSTSQALPVEAAASAQTASEKDNLKSIRGIGPAIERKLNNAGIQTFAGLAGLTKKDLEDILGSQIKRLQDEGDLIVQAKKLARKK